MSSQARIESLSQQHADLESRIKRENKRPQPDENLLQGMKLQKLRVKEEIERLKI